MLRITKVTL